MEPLTEEQKMRKWADAWDRAGPAMAKLREDELRNDRRPLEVILRSFNDLFEKALRDNPPGETSGLVDQQRWFKRLRTI